MLAKEKVLESNKIMPDKGGILLKEGGILLKGIGQPFKNHRPSF